MSRETLLEAEPLYLERGTEGACKVWEKIGHCKTSQNLRSGRAGKVEWCLVPLSVSSPACLFLRNVPCGNHAWLPTNTYGREHKRLFSSHLSSDWSLLFSGSPFWGATALVVQAANARGGILISRQSDAWQPQICEGSAVLKGNPNRNKDKLPPLIVTDFQYCIGNLQ